MIPIIKALRIAFPEEFPDFLECPALCSPYVSDPVDCALCPAESTGHRPLIYRLPGTTTAAHWHPVANGNGHSGGIYAHVAHASKRPFRLTLFEQPTIQAVGTASTPAYSAGHSIIRSESVTLTSVLVSCSFCGARLTAGTAYRDTEGANIVQCDLHGPEPLHATASLTWRFLLRGGVPSWSHPSVSGPRFRRSAASGQRFANPFGNL